MQIPDEKSANPHVSQGPGYLPSLGTILRFQVATALEARLKVALK